MSRREWCEHHKQYHDGPPCDALVDLMFGPKRPTCDVEAAAEALHNRHFGRDRPWEDVPESSKSLWRSDVRRVLDYITPRPEER